MEKLQTECYDWFQKYTETIKSDGRALLQKVNKAKDLKSIQDLICNLIQDGPNPKSLQPNTPSTFFPLYIPRNTPD